MVGVVMSAAHVHCSALHERIKTRAGIPERVTISLGVSTGREFPEPALALETLLKQADAHLYQAKAAGRNRVVIAADSMSPAISR